MQQNPTRRRGFALSELAVVILILALLVGALAPRVTDELAAARDARRIADMARLRDAIERFAAAHGRYPSGSPGADGWDSSADGELLPELVRGGFLRASVLDPRNDAVHAYAYATFPAGACGCQGERPFYVLGVRRFETPAAAAEHPGFFRCARKDWSEDFAYVTGGGVARRDLAPAAAR